MSCTGIESLSLPLSLSFSHAYTQMDQNTHTCKRLKMWKYVAIVLSGIWMDKILLYLDLAHKMYIVSNFALFKVLYILHFKLVS